MLRREDMRKSSFKRNTLYLATAAICIFASVLFSLPAWAEQCYTGCKEGSKEHSSGVTWICAYDRLGNKHGYGEVKDVEDYSYATCTLTIRGQFKTMGIKYGQYKNFQECLQELCIPKVSESCGDLDRCINEKNWKKY
jgi:hypothetical protein